MFVSVFCMVMLVMNCFFKICMDFIMSVCIIGVEK